MVFESLVGLANDRAGLGIRLENQNRVNAIFSDDRRLANARQLRSERLLHVLRKDLQALGRDDHFLLASADDQMAVLVVQFADVAGVEPAVLKRRSGFRRALW